MKKIDFCCFDEEVSKVIDPPQPAKNILPEWYKSSSSYITDENIPIHYDGKNNHTFKKCMPIFDTLTTGYIFTLPSDLYFLDPSKYNGARISWSKFPFDVVDNTHSYGQLQQYPKPNGFDEIFKWKFWWQIKTPPGYSCIFIHPFHRNELPFHTISGIVDTDSFNVPVEFPFFLKRGFTGKIEKGTPIVQIIPLKRDSWEKKDLGFVENVSTNMMKNFSFIGNMYKKNFWNRKRYS